LTATTRILVVDDEHPVRRVLVSWLGGWGHQVVEADSAVAALALMDADPAAILIVDLTMPIYGGLWLIERVRERWPSTRIIVVSGAQDETLIRSAKTFGAIAFVPKPFHREMVHQAIERALLEQAGRDSGAN
jgi:two-component system KDP operon response regulator KdpE